MSAESMKMLSKYIHWRCTCSTECYNPLRARSYCAAHLKQDVQHISNLSEGADPAVNVLRSGKNVRYDHWNFTSPSIPKKMSGTEESSS